MAAVVHHQLAGRQQAGVVAEHHCDAMRAQKPLDAGERKAPVALRMALAEPRPATAPTPLAVAADRDLGPKELGKGGKF